MTDPAFDIVARLLARGVGMRLDPTNRGRLTRAVRDEAESHGMSLSAYVEGLDSDPDALQDLLNRVTVQETSFFRDPGQFAALADLILPELRAAGAPILVWSAGSANGQEAYSLAMSLVEGGITDWRVIASDISTKALARVTRARYRDSEISGLSAERRDRFLTQVPGERLQWEIVPELRERVFAVRHNLAADQPPFEAGQCQVVFCRNVLIYFGHDDVAAFIDRLAGRLTLSSHLFLGYSESLFQISDRFRLVRLGDAFVYQKAASSGVQRREGEGVAERVVERAKRVVERGSLAHEEPASARRRIPAVPAPSSSVELLSLGEAALARGDHVAAIAAFRKAAYVDLDHPIAHLNLGLALEMAGDERAARRAFGAARAALDRADSAVVEAMLEGYHLDELDRFLELKTVAT